MLFDTLGKRLKFCRIALGLKGIEFVESFNKEFPTIKLTTDKYTRWESDWVKKPNAKVVQNLLDLFKKLGIKGLTYEWLIKGSSFPPILFDINTINEDDKAFFWCQMLGESYILRRVALGYREPYIDAGSQLIIRKINYDFSSLKRNLLYCETLDHKVYVGFYMAIGKKLLTLRENSCNIEIKLEDIKIIGIIEWIKRI